MHRAWVVTALLVPVLFAALPLATLFYASPGATLPPDAVVVTTTSDAGAVAMHAAQPEPPRDCSYESHLHIES